MHPNRGSGRLEKPSDKYVRKSCKQAFCSKKTIGTVENLEEHIMKWIWLPAFLYCMLAQAVNATDLEVEAKMASRLEALHKQTSWPGAAMGLAFPTGNFKTIAVGVSDLEKGTPMPTDAVLLAGSIGKIFCAALALKLVEEQVLDLDEPISRWLGTEPWFYRVPNASDLTLRHLLGHGSGIPRHVFKPEFLKAVGADKHRVWKPAELVAYILDDTPKFEAGKGFAYADTNYVLVGMVIEKATGKTYYRGVQRHLLAVSGLKAIYPTDRLKIPNLVAGYNTEKDPLGFPRKMAEAGMATANLQFEWTGGGYATNPGQLAKFALMLYRGEFHGPEIHREMFSGVDAPGLGGSYGLGVMIREIGGIPTYGHDGFMPGYRSFMVFMPDVKASLALQINTTDPQLLGRDVRKIFAQLVSLFHKLLKP